MRVKNTMKVIEIYLLKRGGGRILQLLPIKLIRKFLEKMSKRKISFKLRDPNPCLKIRFFLQMVILNFLLIE